MRILFAVFVSLMSLIFIAGCESGEKIELLYSASYQDTGDFDEVIPVLDNYDDYLASGYPFNINERFFDNYILYSASSYIAVTGRNLLSYEGYLKDGDTLKINLKTTDTIVGFGFSFYVIIFKIDRTLYESVNEITIGEDDFIFHSNAYRVEVVDPNNFLIEPLKEAYVYGESFVIKTSIIYDVDLHLYINGEFHSSQTVIEQNDRYTHWEFYVTMPSHDITVSFQTFGGMGISPN